MPHFRYDDVNEAFPDLLARFAKALIKTRRIELLDDDGKDLDVPVLSIFSRIENIAFKEPEDTPGKLWVTDLTGRKWCIGSLRFVQKIMNEVSAENIGLENTRNGQALYFQHPVTITYISPENRVLTNVVRDANPFFHLAESFWMLAGRNDVASLAFFVPRMKEYSDDGTTFHGAYGHRWRYSFGFDQLSQVINTLHADPHGRRAYLDHWQPSRDSVLSSSSWAKDLPCNLGVAFRVNENNKLDMTVFNRSNDVLWGALGANYVHFGFLQQYVANQIEVETGVYNQISNNLHLYLNRKNLKTSFQDLIQARTLTHNPLEKNFRERYKNFGKEPYFLQRTEWSFSNLNYMLGLEQTDKAEVPPTMPSKLFPDGENTPGEVCQILLPVIRAYTFYRRKQFVNACKEASKIAWLDWREECLAWLNRRWTARAVQGE